MTHFFRAGLDFQERVPILSALRLPFAKVQARVNFWVGTDEAKSFTRQNVRLPFYRAMPEMFCCEKSPNVSFGLKRMMDIE